MSELLKPPAIPVAILNFFASQPDFPAVAGDISEEFQQRAQKTGAEAAKRWYWHEAFRNAWALTRRELMRTPVRTTFMAFGCFFAFNLATGLFWRVKFQSVPRPWDWDIFAIPPLTLLALGLLGGKLLTGREWALALTFTALSLCLFEVRVWHSAPPLWVWVAMSRNGVVHQGLFWLGCLWMRVHSRSFAVNSRKQSSIV